MATPYSKIYNEFLFSVQDYNLLELSQESAERQMLSLMHRSVGRIANMASNVLGEEFDLSLYDDDAEEFEMDIPEDLIDVIVTGMNYYWVMPYVNNTENMYNVLNTKDASQYAPHNMLFRLRELREDMDDRFRRARHDFAQRYGDIENMGG